MKYEDELKTLIFKNRQMMEILRAARTVDLPNWYVGAGLLRNVVWDALHGYEVATAVNDVDVAFFDADELSTARDKRANEALLALLPTVNWEATNQAAVHTWHEAYFGYPIAPLLSAEDGIRGWPETATAVAVRLLADDSLKIFAPCGLDDLFELIVRRNPHKVTLAEYRERYHKKRLQEKWPRITFIDG